MHAVYSMKSAPRTGAPTASLQNKEAVVRRKPLSDVPFNKMYSARSESDYIKQCLESGATAGDGAFTEKCQDLLESLLGCKKALLTTSCTHALEISALLLDIKPGDEILVPSFTFVSTVNAFVLRGARPIFVDIRADTLNMDNRLLSDLITERTKAIVPVHYAGIGCDMTEIMSVANSNNLVVIEDNAHGLLGEFEKQKLGTFGHLGALSFHQTKNFSCGEGGALLINDETFVERAEILREKGTNRSRFFRGQIDKYTWTDLGSSYLPSDILAAVLLAQLEERKIIQSKRQRLWEKYYLELESWSKQNGVTLPVVPNNCRQSFHMFYLLMPSLRIRSKFIEYLEKLSIGAVFHYMPLHTSPMGQSLGNKPGSCPVTEDVSDRLVRLPFFTGMTEDQQEKVLQAVVNFAA